MNKLEHALDLAKRGFRVFPLQPGGKLPHIPSFPTEATTDEQQIQRWWTDPVMELVKDYNIGISTNGWCVVDVDNKGDKHGDDTILSLEMEGKALPKTLEASTPTGGRHLIYRAGQDCRQGVDVLGVGLDIRAEGGFIVGAGSEIGGRLYSWVHPEETPAQAPDWLLEACNQIPERRSVTGENIQETEAAINRATDFLLSAPAAVEGQGGDAATFATVARLKDFGIKPETALDLLLEHWNERCSPPWHPTELERKVHNAYAYGKNDPGVSSAQADFEPVSPEKGASSSDTSEDAELLHPFDLINKEYAFVVAGGGHHILWETTDSKGHPALEHLNVGTFHQKLASQTMSYGGRTRPVTELWMNSDRRRSYDGICFIPQKPAPERFYNLWTGFSVSPDPSYHLEGDSPQERALAAFIDHIYRNICGGSDTLSRWLLGYFAHLIQKPYEKPLVALVLRGSKGVGKNVAVEIVGSLLGNHAKLTSNKRFIVGNFNGHLENCLMLTLDEAFWSGDKQAEGSLKDLITGTEHLIEMKGKEPYPVTNLLRLVIIGNEQWLVPASQDERRYAIFDVGEGRKQDIPYFTAMIDGMESGGLGMLLHYLQNYDISDINVNQAPNTAALLDQKIASLEPFQQWWYDCLSEGQLVGGDLGEDWPENQIETNRFRNAFQRYTREHNIRSRMPSASNFGKHVKECSPLEKARVRVDGSSAYVYKTPDLDTCRRFWESYVGQQVDWSANDSADTQGTNK